MKYNEGLPIYYKWVFNFVQPFRRKKWFFFFWGWTDLKSVQSITHFAFGSVIPLLEK